MARLARWDRTGDGESVDGLRAELQRTMEEYCGVFRTERVLEEGLDKVSALAERLEHARLKDRSKVFNTARIESNTFLVWVAMSPTPIVTPLSSEEICPPVKISLQPLTAQPCTKGIGMLQSQ